MKQYTTSEQTAKLIELGFEKPNSVTEISWQEYENDNPIINANTIEYTRHYSIGELISFLPHKAIREGSIGYNEFDRWFIDWAVTPRVYKNELGIYCTAKDELIDALYEMILTLKEDGVI